MFISYNTDVDFPSKHTICKGSGSPAVEPPRLWCPTWRLGCPEILHQLVATGNYKTLKKTCYGMFPISAVFGCSSTVCLLKQTNRGNQAPTPIEHVLVRIGWAEERNPP